MGCQYGSGDPVGLVESGWTGDTNCDEIGGFVTLTWTRFGRPIGDIACASDADDPVGCVSQGWTGGGGWYSWLW